LDELATAEGLIVDLRGYPSEFVLFEIAQHFVKAPVEFAGFTHPDFQNPVMFLWGDLIAITPEPPFIDVKIAILVDETTPSQAEFTAMALRALPNSIVVGSQTAGADGNISAVILTGGIRGSISGLGVCYPDRRPTQQVGTLPDIKARPTTHTFDRRRSRQLLCW
jgi:C-terminal processing protease CtpA/Prc